MSKHKVQSVKIRGMEGLITHCQEYDGKVFPSIREFDKVLSHLSLWAPKEGGYNKIHFVVTFDDGETYEGRYDLKHFTLTSASLARHMLEHLNYVAGRGDKHADEAKVFLANYEAA